MPYYRLYHLGHADRIDRFDDFLAPHDEAAKFTRCASLPARRSNCGSSRA